MLAPKEAPAAEVALGQPMARRADGWTYIFFAVGLEREDRAAFGRARFAAHSKLYVRIENHGEISIFCAQRQEVLDALKTIIRLRLNLAGVENSAPQPEQKYQTIQGDIDHVDRWRQASGVQAQRRRQP